MNNLNVIYTTKYCAVLIRNRFKLVLVASFILAFGSLFSQTSIDNNSTGNPDFLGWTTGQGFPLIIKHEAPRLIIFERGGDEKMYITPQGGVRVGFTGSLPNGNATRFSVVSDENVGIQINGNQFFNPTNVVGARFYSNGSVEEDFGVTGFAFNLLEQGSETIGAWGRASGATVSDVGILARRCPTDGNDNAALFNGNVFATGMLMGLSDESLKENVSELDNSHNDLLKEVDLYSYNFQEDNEALHLPEGNQYGFLAQEVAEAFPSLVKRKTIPKRRDMDGNLLTDSVSHLAVNYDQFIALSVNAYHVQDSIISNNSSKLDELESRLQQLSDELANGISQNTNNLTEGSDKLSLKLKAFPNPVSNTLNVQYESMRDVDFTLRLYDINGRIVLEQNISDSEGLNTISIDISTIENGTYELELGGNNISETTKIIKN